MDYRQFAYEFLEPCIIPRYSFIRIFNSIPQCPSVDIYVDDQLLIARNISYKEMTPYFPAREGVYNIKIYLSGSKNTLVSEIEELQIYGEQIITFAIEGSLENMDMIAIVDNINETVFPDRSKTRIANLTFNSLAYTISLGTNKFNGELASNQVTEYIETLPGEYILEIRPEHRSNTISIEIDIKPGRIYTIYILDSIPRDSIQYQEANIPQIIQAVDGNSAFKKCDVYYTD